MVNSKIEWTDHTWNWSQRCPGCPDSMELGCKHCYARERAKRWRLDFSTPKRTGKETFYMPMTSGAIRTDDTIFTLSLGDFFHPLNDPIRPEAWDIVINTPFIYLILTKFPELILDRLPKNFEQHLDHVMLGFTAENQAMYNKRFVQMNRIKNKFDNELRIFSSMEPFLGPIVTTIEWKNDLVFDTLQGEIISKTSGCIVTDEAPFLDWVIVGGETGPSARPMNPEWVRSIRNQCQLAGTPFFFKSWGEWIPSYDAGYRSEEPAEHHQTIGQRWVKHEFEFPDGQRMVRVGKKAAGNLLDGVVWNQLPGGERS
jgi:protein gp37